MSSTTKQNDTSESGNSSIKVPLLIVGIIVLIAAMGFLTSRTSFNEEDVARGLDATFNEIGEYLLASGSYNGEVQYESLTLEGSFLSRHAVIHNPQFTITDQAQGQYIVTTESVSVVPKDAGLTQFTLIAEKPWVIRSGDVEFRIIPQSAVEMDVMREAGKALNYNYEFPEDEHFIIQHDNLFPEGKDSSYQVRIGAESSGLGVLDVAENSYYEEASLQNISVEYEQTVITAETLTALYEIAGHDNSRFHHYNIGSEGIEMSGPYKPLGKLKLALELEEEVPQGMPTQDRVMSLTNLNIEGEDFTLSGSGEVDLLEGEMLPFGSLDVQVTSVDALLQRLGKATIIPQPAIPVAQAVVEQAATPTGEEGQLSLNLQRHPGGSFLIGNSTFEELTVSLLREFLRGGKVKPLPLDGQPAANDTGSIGEVVSEEVEEGSVTEETPAADAAAVDNAEASETRTEEITDPLEEAEVPLATDVQPEATGDAENTETEPAQEEEASEVLKEELEDAAEALEEANEALENLKENLKEVEEEVVPAVEADEKAATEAPSVDAEDETPGDSGTVAQ